MTTKIVLPNGNLICNETMNSVDLIAGKAVVCRDSCRKIIAWIPVKDKVKSEMLRKIMIDFARAGRWGKQPCWNFLNEEEETSIKQ